MIRGALRRLLVAPLLAALPACERVLHREVAAPREVWEWQECADCGDAALALVVARGASSVPALEKVLAPGPPAERVAAVRAVASRLVTTGAGAPLDSAQRAAVVDKQLGDYDRQYRRRAMRALAAIGGAGARQALCDARPLPALADLAVMLDSAIARTGGPCP